MGVDKRGYVAYNGDSETRKEVHPMYRNIDVAKLADVQDVATKLTKLPEMALAYITGYTEGALDASRKQTAVEREKA